ncbi:MAG: ATP-dependent helicase RecQ [Thermoanaerobaculia bacterium]|jgi:ATP-dependent DNA helicase RecQ|nr:ATP-dependent helicase RecQ [Thermoanaerobaculia bacterium]
MTRLLDRLRDIISHHWGYDSFRPLQQEAMLATLDRRDSLVVMPTGGGKSLCYQAPALLSEHVTVVVSPLISLMKDQVDGLRECGVAAAQLNSSQRSDQQREIERDVLDGKIKLLFASPERLAMGSFRDLLKRANVRTFAIDEAHCISHWGHDFRPEYRQLRDLRKTFPEASVHAYTATATPKVRQDIIEQLSLREAVELVGDFDRPNLTYRVLPRTKEWEQVLEVIGRHQGDAGIIYCIRRRDVDSLSEKLRRKGINAVAYHAGLTPDERRGAQETFLSEKCDVVVATVAFGMGIDRSNVRFVLHTGMPKSIEHYQQESGRAGRDGLEAECVMLYSAADTIFWRSMIERGTDGVEPDPAYVESAMRHVRDLDRYCSAAACRHRSLVAYFGQQYATENCRACDICLGETESVPDSLIIAQKILSCVYRVGQAFGVGHVTSVLRGEDLERIRDRGHDRQSTFGLLKAHSKHELREWIYQLIAQDFLRQTGDEYPVLHLGGRARDAMKGAVEVKLRQPAASKKEKAAARATSAASLEPLVAHDRELFEALRKWRRAEAEHRGVPPYVIFGDKTLRELARLRPTTLVELRGIYGIGDAKLEAFGDTLITQIREHCATAPS